MPYGVQRTPYNQLYRVLRQTTVARVIVQNVKNTSMYNVLYMYTRMYIRAHKHSMFFLLVALLRSVRYEFIYDFSTIDTIVYVSAFFVDECRAHSTGSTLNHFRVALDATILHAHDIQSRCRRR